MPQYHHIKNAVVILAEEHNPTVLSDSFLLRTGFISSEGDIDRTKSAFLPVVSTIVLQDGTEMSLEAKRLVVSRPHGLSSWELAEVYCKSLPHIHATAIGLNFAVHVEIDERAWFTQFEGNSKYRCLNLAFTHDGMRAFIKKSGEAIDVDFNFHYNIERKPLGELEFDFESETSKNIQKLDSFIKSKFE